MSNILENNLKLLKDRYPKILMGLGNSPLEIHFEIINCVDGNKTAKIKSADRDFLLHSKYRPIEEARIFAGEKMKEQAKVNILFGFGMGYHVVEMQKLLKDNNELYVFDVNIGIFKESLKYLDIIPVLNDARIHLQVSPDLTNILMGLEKVLSSKRDMNIILHVPSIQAVPDELEQFKFVLEDWNIRKSLDDKYGNLLSENFQKNNKVIDRNAAEFFGKFTDIPFLIVSAGPSLDKNINLIKDVKGKAFILSVGSAVKALLKSGVNPDAFVIIDPQEHNIDQIKGIEDIGIPGIFLATACTLAVEKYNGPKYLAVQDKAYAKQGEENMLVSTGGSVATTAIDIALQMGGNPIILVGQDLAFSDNRKHVADYAHEKVLNDINPLKNSRTVKGSSGETLYTTLGLLSYKRWIENRIEDEKGKMFINSTQGGAFIKGAKHISLKEAMDKYLSKIYDLENMVRKIVYNN